MLAVFPVFAVFTVGWNDEFCAGDCDGVIEPFGEVLMCPVTGVLLVLAGESVVDLQEGFDEEPATRGAVVSGVPKTL